MSYSEENGKVVLTMSREDYYRLLRVFAMATVHASISDKPALQVDVVVALLNRLNEGNPNFTPYQVR